MKKNFYNDCFERKSIIDELEGSFSGAPIDVTNPDVPLVAVEANDDEDIIEGTKTSKINKSRDKIEIDI